MKIVIDILEQQDCERVIHGSRMPVARMRNAIRNGTKAAEVGIKAINTLNAIKEQITSIKRNAKSENNDYLTGYLCALSAVEGMIAEGENADNN